MKIGWIVWEWDGDKPIFYEDGFEPEYCFKKIRIVYTELP